MENTHFKLGMYLPELRLPFDEALAKAKEIGVEYISGSIIYPIRLRSTK